MIDIPCRVMLARFLRLRKNKRSRQLSVRMSDDRAFVFTSDTQHRAALTTPGADAPFTLAETGVRQNISMDFLDFVGEQGSPPVHHRGSNGWAGTRFPSASCNWIYWGLVDGAAELAPTRADHKSVARIANIKEE